MMNADTLAILVTGSAGGLGQTIVRACADSFPEMVIVAADLPGAMGGIPEEKMVLPVALDVTDEEEIIRLRGALENQGIRAWGIVNNAGISDFFPVSEKPKEYLDKLFAVNTFGPVNMVRGFLAHLMETKGRVVQVSSESVRLPAAFHPYAASKIAQEALSVSMRNELALKGVHLSILRPGAINTPFLHDLEAMKGRIGDSIYREYLLRFSEQAPKQIRHITSPEKVSAVVVKILKTRKPRRYYHVNNNPMLRIAERMPERWTDYFMRKLLEK